MTSPDQVAGFAVYYSPVNTITIEDPADLLVQNRGPGRLYLSYTNQNDPNHGILVASGEQLAFRVDRNVYVYGNTSDPDVSVPGSTAKAWVVVMITVA